MPASVVVLCEGEPNGIDVRLLEAARLALEQGGGMDWLRLVKFVPAGGKGELRGSLRARRELAGDQPVRFAAIRDRDFLREVDLLNQRAEAVRVDGDRAWPLSRHTIESYLLEEALLAAEGVPPAVIASLPQLAAKHLWHDLARSSVEVVRLLANRERIQLAASVDSIHDRAGALHAAKAAAAAWQVRIDSILGQTATTLEAEIDADEKDFRASPVLHHRVHGKDLLGAIAEAAGIRDLRHRLLRGVEHGMAPVGLVDDLRDFLTQLAATF